ncbi:SGNH/GDSL hydrolase family protein [Aquabacterium sp.]|uniref:SGNH/GDSL hydrolase family protein n=1 Tax=Aquabacterium sp. TaxID=1872578 RepID=UPI002C6991BE|nr:SGNH/GDSL hydrolase family protein [Aquabacterium sp.]HSW04998.1 SGNH/GDSL hydrolase family protein [Aquabacterium sp.]
MKTFRILGLSLITAALLAACGGGDPTVPGSGTTTGAPTTKGSFTTLVSFGDSLSDVGAYAPATSIAGNGSAPYLGGKFTTNSATGTVWVENLAAQVGVAVTPAEVGFAGQSVKCPAAAVSSTLASTCTGYGQGGSRVTDPNGIGHAGGALTVPVVTQIANHLARFSSFKDSDLILIWAGSNDVFAQFGAFTAKAAQIQADALAGKLTADQAQLALFNAQTAAQTEMKNAAQDLARYVREQILAKGGKYVAVMNLADIVDTPFGSTLPASVRPVLTDLSLIFNLWLRDGLTNQPVQIVDSFAILKESYQNPAKYGFVNNTVPACDGTKIAALTGGRVTDGSSLFCNTTAGVPFNALRTGADVTTWAFADGVHPSTGGHKALSDAFHAQLKSFGWL